MYTISQPLFMRSARYFHIHNDHVFSNYSVLCPFCIQYILRLLRCTHERTGFILPDHCCLMHLYCVHLIRSLFVKKNKAMMSALGCSVAIGLTPYPMRHMFKQNGNGSEKECVLKTRINLFVDSYGSACSPIPLQ